MQHNHIKNRIVIQACCNGKRLYVELLKHMNEYFLCFIINYEYKFAFEIFFGDSL